MLFTRMSSRPNTSVGRTIAWGISEARSASSARAFPEKYGNGRVESRVRDAHVDDASHACTLRRVEQPADVLDGAVERRRAPLEANPVRVVERVDALQALAQRVVERERRDLHSGSRADEPDRRGGSAYERDDLGRAATPRCDDP